MNDLKEGPESYDLMTLIALQKEMIDTLIKFSNKQTEQMLQITSLVQLQGIELTSLGLTIKKLQDQSHQDFSVAQLTMLSNRLRRNFLPNDNAIMQKQLMATWRVYSDSVINYKELLQSGFRVFSQNDEDGVLLRIFSHIGIVNHCVVEIGSNCDNSDIGMPENLSTNLIVNHGWHGVIFEMDQTECDTMRYFFARDFSTKHFHEINNNGENGYFSPIILPIAVSAENINQLLRDAHIESEPDLMVIDIDGGDYAVMQSMRAIRPRVLVIEFEKRFRDRYSVVQFDKAHFSKNWAQSGTASLPAWEKLLNDQGYTLCAVGSCGFNAFFVRSDIAFGKFSQLTSSIAFDTHPILSKVPEDFWISPDETWHLI